VAEAVRVVFLGGLGEIGRNCACVEIDDRILVLDCGVLFPDAEMPGIDLVLPDFSYLWENGDRVEACILTHGHDDHIGGLPFLVRQLSFPVYGSPLTLGLAGLRLEEAGLSHRVEFRPVSDGDRLRIGPFDVELIPVAHSVPHGFAVALRTPQGIILHTGDFKLDPRPVDGRRTDLARIGALADGVGIRLLLSDSTNADEPGYADSESEVGKVLRRLFAEREGKRLVTTCFASHLHRIQQIADAAISTGRVVATLGRSMAKNVALARQLRLLDLPDDALMDIEETADLPPGRVCVLSTGSQGEPMSAMALMAAGENKWVQIGPEDVVVISANAIPGNETAVAKVIDGLCRRGAEVVHPGLEPVHTSGHARRVELETMVAVAHPEWFIPVHGEFRHLAAHAQLAGAMGIAPGNAVVCQDGDVVVLTDEGLRLSADSVPAGYLYVDGTVGEVGRGVLRDRRALAEEGVVVVVVAVDGRSGAVVTGPEIVTRGWVHAPEAEELLEEARAAVLASLAEAAAAGATDQDTLRRHVRSAMGQLVAERTRRRPMIVPLVMEI
jgi:ribonuclease J